MTNRNIIYLAIIIALFSVACNNTPKVITAESENDGINADSGIFTEESTSNSNMNINNTRITEDLHTVVVNEILPSARYSYIKVTEEDESYWIATRKNDIEVGGIYYYKSRLLKTNYESKEHNKVFDKIYLVSNLVSQDHRMSTNTEKNDITNYNETEHIKSNTSDIVQKEGSVKIADIVANQKEYNGKIVQLTGVCVKINPNIMERNWIHLQDGSQDDFDLVITSDTFVNEGEVITIQAKVSLNKDFGAGYTYNLILEDGIIVE